MESIGVQQDSWQTTMTNTAASLQYSRTWTGHAWNTVDKTNVWSWCMRHGM